MKDSSLNAVKAAMKPVQADGVQVAYNGSVYPGWRTVISEVPELIGLIIAFGILMITFGAFAVFLDAFVVRLTLVPTVMAIIGSGIWYHPHCFARHIPDPDIEGQRLATSPPSESSLPLAPQPGSDKDLIAVTSAMPPSLSLSSCAAT